MIRKIPIMIIICMIAGILITPVLAIGPSNAEEQNPFVVIDGFNTQMWLPSGVMNEWIEVPIAPGPFRVTLKDASKFQINTATIPVNIMQIYANENQWFYWTQDDFRAFLFGGGYDTAIADNYEALKYFTGRIHLSKKRKTDP